MLIVLFIVNLSLIIYGLILSYWTLKKRHGFIVYRDEKNNQYKVSLIHLNALNFLNSNLTKKTSLFRFILKSYFHYLMYQFENETDSKDLLKIFKKQQEKDKARIKIFNK